jgi:hypothetical protein
VQRTAEKGRGAVEDGDLQVTLRCKAETKADSRGINNRGRYCIPVEILTFFLGETLSNQSSLILVDLPRGFELLREKPSAIDNRSFWSC